MNANSLTMSSMSVKLTVICISTDIDLPKGRITKSKIHREWHTRGHDLITEERIDQKGHKSESIFFDRSETGKQFFMDRSSRVQTASGHWIRPPRPFPAPATTSLSYEVAVRAWCIALETEMRVLEHAGRKQE